MSERDAQPRWSRRALRPALQLAAVLYGSSLLSFATLAGAAMVALESTPGPESVTEIAGYLLAACESNPDPVACVERANPLLPGTVSLVEPDGERHGAFHGDGDVCGRATGTLGTIELCVTPPLSLSSMLGALLLAALVSIFVALVLTRRFIGPLAQLTAAARAVSRGELRVRTGIRDDGAFGEVGHAFDTMVDDVRGLLDAEKELLASLSHELRTPLTRLRLALDLAADGVALDGRALEGVRGDVEDLDELLTDLLDAARLQLTEGRAASPLGRVTRRTLEAATLAESALTAARERFPRVELVLHPASERDVRLEGSERLLRRALRNLLENAARVSPDGAPVTLRCDALDGWVSFAIEDSGPGVPGALGEEAFAPFVRGEPSERAPGATASLGLGLTMARRIAEGHGGTLSLTPRSGGGTVATLRVRADGALPRHGGGENGRAGDSG
jgi:signal transduction histidine kinase